MLLNSIFFLLISLSIVDSFPCPSECICKPIDVTDVDFTRMSYLIDCSNKILNSDKLIYQADQWSINEDKIINQDADDSVKDYIISIDLSNSLSLKKFTSKTIQLDGFSYSIQSLSLTNQSKDFILESDSFNLPLYQHLTFLNLSSCCKQIQKKCQQILHPLEKLEILDLSGSNMYKTCLHTPGTISAKLTDLYLRNNVYTINIFSSASRIFNGVREISGKLDLQNSRFELSTPEPKNCLFNIFREIKTLDLSSIQFNPNTDNINNNLAYLLECELQSGGIRQGEQLLHLYLRQLNIRQLPQWFTTDRFPSLTLLDLSNNNIRSIDFSSFLSLSHISLAYNPIEFKPIHWRADTLYKSINLRSTTSNQTFDLRHRLKLLLKLTANFDFSENKANISTNLTNFPSEFDFPTGFDISTSRISLNLSQTNIKSFKINSEDLYRLDISFNSLVELDLSEQNKLSYLDCSNQYGLNKLKLNEDLSTLIELKCSNNSLETIENFSSLQSQELKLIDLSNNKIHSLHKLFSNLNSRALRRIYLQSNVIQVIQTNIFHKKLFSLYEINLSWNKIHTIEEDAFRAPNLQILDLRGNPLINVEPKAILTISLRLFYIVNNTEQLADRCKNSNSSDNLLPLYVNWFEQNGSLMNSNEIQLNKCLRRYSNQKTVNWVIKKSKHVIQFYSLYVTIGICIIAVFFGGIHLYRKNKIPFIGRFQRYKKLDRHSLVENGVEMDQREDEGEMIVMNIKEPPFNKSTQAPRTNV